MINGMFNQLNTKEDYYLAMQLFEPSRYVQIFQDLLDTRVMWVKDSELSDSESGVSDTTHKIVIVPQVGGGQKYYQYILQDDPEAKIYKLGFTLDEVRNIIDSVT